MWAMTNPYEDNPQAQPSQPNPYGQPGQGSPTNPYDQPGQAQPSPPGPYGQSGQYQPSGQPMPYGQQPYGQQPYGAPPQEHPQGTLILVFGILGIFITIFAPIAWYLGNKAKNDIKASGIQYSNEQNVSTTFRGVTSEGSLRMVDAFGHSIRRRKRSSLPTSKMSLKRMVFTTSQ